MTKKKILPTQPPPFPNYGCRVHFIPELPLFLGHPRYAATEDGRGLTWVKKGRGLWKWMELSVRSPRKDHPFASVEICGLDDWRLPNARRNMPLAHLILLAFVGPKPSDMEACHNDGNPFNNRLSNLRWDTHAANMADSKRHGTTQFGAKSHSAKLTEADVIEIRARRAAGETCKSIGRSKRINPATVSRVATGEKWAYLSDGKRPKTFSRVSDAEKQEISRLRISGMLYSEIAGVIGRHKTIVEKIGTELGFPSMKGRRRRKQVAQ